MSGRYTPVFKITPLLLEIITRVTELKAWIDAATVDVVWLPRIQKETAVRMAHSSTAIEGNPLTLSEVEAIERGDEVFAPHDAELEIKNALKAIRWIWKSGNPITEKGLLHLHRLLTQELLVDSKIGAYKTATNKIVDSKGRPVYFPPPPEAVPHLTRELLDWLSEERTLHPVLVAAIAHHRLVSIHPFADGNGRISRALAAWVLWTRGFDTRHLFSWDEFFQANREQYYLKLQQARDLDDDLTLWLEFAVEGLAECLAGVQKRISSLKINSSKKIHLTERQEAVLRYLSDKGRVKSPQIEKDFRITRARVNQIIKPLVEAGFIVREGQTRATTYRLK